MTARIQPLQRGGPPSSEAQSSPLPKRLLAQDLVAYPCVCVCKTGSCTLRSQNRAVPVVAVSLRRGGLKLFVPTQGRGSLCPAFVRAEATELLRVVLRAPAPPAAPRAPLCAAGRAGQAVLPSGGRFSMAAAACQVSVAFLSRGFVQHRRARALNEKERGAGGGRGRGDVAASC